MKRYVLMLFLLISAFIYPEEVSIENIIESYLKNNLEIKIIGIEEEQQKIEENNLNYEKYKKISYNVHYEKSGYNISDKNSNKIYSDDYTGELAYRSLFLRNTYYKDSYDNITNKLILGVRKNVSDIFYNKLSYQEKIISNKNKEISNRKKFKKIDGVEEVTSLYSEILKVKYEMEVNKSLEVEYNEVVKNMKKKLKEGKITEVNFKIAELELTKIQNKIAILEDCMVNLKKEISILTGENYEIVNEFQEITEYKYIENTMDSFEISALKIQKEEKEEYLKFLKRELSFNLDISIGYDVFNEESYIALQLNGDLLKYNRDKMILKKELEKIKLEIKDAEKNIIKKGLEDEMKYKKLENSVRENETDLKIKQLKMEYAKKLFEEGYSELEIYLNSKSEFVKSQIAYKNAVDLLNIANLLKKYKMENMN